MKTNFSLVFLMIFLCYCHRPSNQNSKHDINQFVKNETNKWKKELLINGEVGTPCNFITQEEWAKKNPEVFYGLPDSILSIVTDVNSDKINDFLLFFPAGDCCSCSVGINEGSDFLKLIYSNGTDFLSNDHLREKIASKIEGEYFAQTNAEVGHAIFSVTNLETEISGKFKLWTIEDPDCCASVEGTFKYNPFNMKIELKQHNVEY